MSEVLTGKGPQPPRVYWIRRGLVAVVAIAIIAALVWAFTPKNQPTTATPATTSPAPAETLVSPTASPTGSTLPTADSSTAAPTACEPIGVQLSVAGFKSVKNTGKQVFSVTAENNTAMPCVMEITGDTFRLRVTSGADLIWSTAHCAKWLPDVKKQTLQAGKSLEFKIEWTLYRSAEGCKQAKSLLGVGTYVAQANYRETATGRFVFVVTD